eukprot:GHRR01020160.1.p1 GENE.GHRR01020160.1~~GHRR01020160.1.p1  ORF type:complete len:209 (+),score=69.72 GHRR01020160.1:265-891(+)
MYSADGEYVLCGSEDGTTTIWDFETGTPTSVPHLSLGGAPVYCMAWNKCFQTVTVCSFSPYAPIRVVCINPDAPLVVLNPPNEAAALAARIKRPVHAQVGSKVAGGLQPRYHLPDRLTPYHVHSLLSDLRVSAAERGIYKQPEDPEGQHLVVKSNELVANKHLSNSCQEQHSNCRHNSRTAETAGNGNGSLEQLVSSHADEAEPAATM